MTILFLGSNLSIVIVYDDRTENKIIINLKLGLVANYKVIKKKNWIYNFKLYKITNVKCIYAFSN